MPLSNTIGWMNNTNVTNTTTNMTNVTESVLENILAEQAMTESFVEVIQFGVVVIVVITMITIFLSLVRNRRGY